MYEAYGNREDKILNARHNKSMRLYDKLLEDFSQESFTVEDIVNSYNAQTKYQDRDIVRGGFGSKHLKYLTDQGLLIHDADNNSYKISIGGIRRELANQFVDNADDHPYYGEEPKMRIKIKD